MTFNLPAKKISCVISVVSCIMLIIISPARGNFPESKIQAASGVIALSDYPGAKSIELGGEWELYRGRLLAPGDFAENNIRNRAIITVPGLWKDDKNLELSGEGYATYRLIIQNDSGKKTQSITFSGILSAYRLWINNELVSQRGILDESDAAKNQFLFVHHNRTVFFQMNTGINEIVLQVLNYHYSSGGIKDTPIMENAETTNRKHILNLTVNRIIVSILFFLSIFNLLQYFSRKEDPASLHLGLLCLNWAVYLFNLLFPVISDFFQEQRIPYLIDYITTILIPPLCLKTFKELYPEESSSLITRIIIALALIFVAIISVTSFKISEILISIYYIICIFSIIYMIYAFIRVIVKRKPDSLLFFTGFTAFFFVSVNDILHTLKVINTGLIFQYGMLIFSLSATLVVIRRFTTALRKVEALTKVLEEKNIALMEMDRIKDQFLANTSHELRTPLHGMIGLSESMIHGSAGRLPAEAVENLSLIASSGHRLAGMVNDLLDMAKIESGDLSLNLRSVDLYSLSEVAVKLSATLIGDKDLKIINNIRPGIPMVMADEDRIKQVMHNLLGNAVKFTNKGIIDISARIIDTEDETGIASKKIEVSISDTGIGVPEEYREKIFDVYQQVDSGDARIYQGTGLGLSIARHIIELHKGAIRLTPRESGGSVFSFTLPAANEPIMEYHEPSITGSIDESVLTDVPAEAVRLPGSAGNIMLNNALILLVDDDPVNIRIIENYLKSRGGRVITASDGIMALDIIDKNRSIDLVLLDIMMPIISGYEVCARIREKLGSEELPVIMLTAKNMMSDINAAFEAGANDYIVKPFNITELLFRVNTMLKLKKVTRSATEGINISARNNVYSIKFRDIIYITSKAKNIIVHTNERDIDLPVLLKDIIERLPPDIFMRIHKSHIININYIHNIRHVISGRYMARLIDSDDTELPVGPSFLNDLRKKIKK